MIRRIGAIFLSVLAFPAAALATDEEEVFIKSLKQNIGQEADYTRFLAWLLGAAGVAVAVIIFRQWQKRQAVPRALNHPGKLMREVVKVAEIDPAEMKKMKALAAELDCEHALTLLLCPSLTQPPEESPQGEAA